MRNVAFVCSSFPLNTEFSDLARPSEDFQFRGVPDSRKGFARLVEEISEELTT